MGTTPGSDALRPVLALPKPDRENTIEQRFVADAGSFSGFREFLATLDISLPKAGALRPEQFNRILARVRGRDSESLVNEVVLRSQAQAVYAADNFGHFGLNRPPLL